jgi:SAM-dependent methyltransferase
LAADEPALEGVVDSFTDGSVRGWAWDRRRPSTPIAIQVWNGKILVATELADGFRADLSAAGMGDGKHAFSCSHGALPQEGAQVSVRFAESGVELDRSPIFLRNETVGPDLPADVYATPLDIPNLKSCYFYHTMDIPGHGTVEGEWDLRKGVTEYLGGVEFRNKRVLDVGKASGFLTFHMESKGAEVVGYDLSGSEAWDVVPFARYDHQRRLRQTQVHIGRLNNGFWLAHRAFGSKAKLVHGTVYTIPEAIGIVDITLVSAILCHVRDPFRALEKALRLTRETVIVTEEIRDPALVKGTQPIARFLPDPATCEPKGVWWSLPPDVIKRFIGVLGFEDVKVTFHSQPYKGTPIPCLTVVGRRTKGSPVV